MTTLFWRAFAWLVSRPWVFAYLLKRAQRTPYTHILGPDGADVYMYRWWLFNAYSEDHGQQALGSDVENRRFPRLPSVRVHHICRPDGDRDRHNHPWEEARTFVMQGFYIEEREGEDGVTVRSEGDTATLNNDLFHRIAYVSPGGVYTLFFTWRKVSSWGFLRDGVFVPWREYLGLDK